MLAWLREADSSNIVPITQALANELYELINELIPHYMDPDEPLPPLVDKDKRGFKDELDRLALAIIAGANRSCATASVAGTSGGGAGGAGGYAQRNSGFIGAMPLSMSRRSLQVQYNREINK